MEKADKEPRNTPASLSLSPRVLPVHHPRPHSIPQSPHPESQPSGVGMAAGISLDGGNKVTKGQGKDLRRVGL